MPVHRHQIFVLAYDIADPQRLVQVHRTVRRWGIPLQYSVFLVPSTPTGLDALLDELDDIIDNRVDDIRVYPLPARLEFVHFGRQVLPEGVEFISGNGTLHSAGQLVSERFRQ
jgi:CRISPR-associated protein Cas2